MAGTEGTITFTEVTFGSVKKITAEWVSGTGDYADIVSADTEKAYDGKVLGVATIPGTAGDAPTLNYDVYIKDADGLDILLGAGENRSDTTTEYVAEASVAATAKSILTFTVLNAGSANTGTVVIWIR